MLSSLQGVCIMNSTNGLAGLTFKGYAVKMPERNIKCAADAIAQWEILKHPQYTNIFQESEYVSRDAVVKNKEIREENYRFLDLLTKKSEKLKFIDYFKKVTGFPNIKECSDRMVKELQRVLSYSAKVNNTELLLSGYDRFCSTGLKSSLPGSDIDKAYGIVRGDFQNSLESQKELSNRVKASIWNNIDNRLVSVNHCAAFPNIMTDKEVAINMYKFDNVASSFVNANNFNFFQFLRARDGNPITGSKFNIWLSERINSKEDKEDAKNFAYIIEAIRDGARSFINEGFFGKLCDIMNSSIFGWCSNITQAYVMQQKYDYSDIIKPKLKARQEVQDSFNSWSISKQYDLVKDIIRSMSGDNNNPEFNTLFASKSDNHRLLINDILKGHIDCAFENLGDGNERVHLFFKTPEAVERYHNLNVYDTDY